MSDACTLAVLQVPLKDRSIREAPAGGFAKGAPAAALHCMAALVPCHVAGGGQWVEPTLPMCKQAPSLPSLP